VIDRATTLHRLLRGRTHRTGRTTAHPRPPAPSQVGTLRFAFYGRMSTAGYQDDASSRQWQHDSAARLITGHGQIVASYFDVGVSRSLQWQLRALP
jgi:hypothetical protein